MKKQLRTLWLALLAGVYLAGCGSGGGSTGPEATQEPVIVTKSVSGIASKGPINNGNVTVFAVDENGTIGASLGGALTTAEGTYSVNIGTYTGNILVQVTGGTYTDEATGVNDKPNPGLRAAVAGISADVSVAITPLTEVAVQYTGGTLTKTRIDDANSLVSTMAGVDIITTMPANVLSSIAATATEAETTYGLMLASLSQLAQDYGEDISDTISLIKDDLSDNKMLDDTGSAILDALAVFCDPSNPYNKTNVDDAAETPLDNTISDLIDKPAILLSEASDLAKAKALIADLRNTALSIYNYNGVGAPGIVETPFSNLAQELETEIAPELTATIDRLGWVIESAGFVEAGMTETFQHPDYGLLTLEISLSDDSKTGSFTVYDEDGISDSGTLTLDNPDRPTFGTFDATMKTENGEELKVVLDYSATTDNNGMYTGMTLTGSMTAPGLSLDFSQSGRKISVTFADNPDSDYLDDIYPTNIIFSGRITTGTAQMDGELDIPSILWASRAYGYTDWQYSSNNDWTQVEVCEGEFRPQKATFKGSFSELQNGTPTGVKFSGTITGNLNNAFTFDGCDMEDATNFLKWDASFDGTIEAPSRPTVTTFLKVAQSEYRKLALDVSYSRTNTDGTKVFLSGNGTLEEKTNPVPHCDYWGYCDEDDYTVLQAFLKNQDGLNVNIFHDSSKSEDKKFSGSITTAGGAEMADLYTTNGVPMVKYIDYSIESIF